MSAKPLVAASLLLISGFLPCGAAPMTQQERARVFASLPDWTGIWETVGWSKRTAGGKPVGGIAALKASSVLTGHPPYNAEWEAKYQAGMKNVDALRATEAARKTCSFSFPIAMESPSIFQIAVTPEETLFVFVTQDVRHIYTDGRKHPPADELWPTRMGDSVAHWEGDTLVIDTIARLPAEPIGVASPFSKLSERAHFTERVRRVSRDELQDVMTIEDPVALARPWTVTLKYHRVTDLDRMGNYDCLQNDRNPIVDGKLTIKPD
jgi:hypothetical protein